jgi:hypothetical protein
VALDGVNADRYPSDYTLTKRTINKNTKIDFSMSKGGGFVLVVKKK